MMHYSVLAHQDHDKEQSKISYTHIWQFSRDNGTKVRTCKICHLTQRRGRKRWNTVRQEAQS